MKSTSTNKLVWIICLLLGSQMVNAQIDIATQYWQKNTTAVSTNDRQWMYEYTGEAGNVYLRKSGFSYVHNAVATDTLYQHRVDVELLGAHSEVNMVSYAPVDLPINVYNDDSALDPSSKQYREIRYENVYDRIDLVFKVSPNKNVKYEFVLHPGADPKQIRLRYEGHDNLQLSKDGAVHITTSLGEVIEPSPTTFYGNNHGEVIESAFKLNEEILEFHLAPYDTRKTVIIDPEIKWSTFFGGNSNDLGESIAIGSDESVYVCGSTASSNFSTSTGASQRSLQGLQDAFVYKLDKDGQLKWATYFGGLSIDKATDIAVSKNDEVYITGVTSSINLNVSLNALQLSLSGGTDAFLAKFDSSGTLAWSTYYGGTSDDEGKTVAVDDDGFVYAGGNTQSSTLNITTGAFQTSIGGGSDGFLSKFNPTGKLIWSTFIGGNLGDELVELTLDSSANIYLLGRTSSSNFPITTNVLQTALAGNNDLFVAQFDSAGARKWATFLGGLDDEYPSAISFSENGAIHVVGGTESSTFPTKNALQPNYGGGILDGFYAVINLKGQLIRSTFIGGTAVDEINTVYSTNGYTYLAGLTESTNLPVSSNAYQTSKSTGLDGYLMRFDSLGNRLYSSYFGGNSDDRLNDIVEHRGTALWTGYSRSTNYPTSAGSLQSSNAGGNDVVATSFCEGFSSNRISLYGKDTGLICVQNPVDTIQGNLPSEWYSLDVEWQENSGGAWKTIQNATSYSYTPGFTSGSKQIRRILTYGFCSDTSNALLLKVAPSPQVDFNYLGLRCVEDAIKFKNNSSIKSGSLNFLWTFGDGDSSTLRNPSHTYKASGQKTLTLQVTSDLGCRSTVVDNISVHPNPKANFTFENSCTRDSVEFSDNSSIASGNYSVKWYLGNRDSASQNQFKYKYATEAVYLVNHVVTSDSGCVDSSSKVIFIDSAQKAHFSFNTFCGLDTVLFQDKSSLSTGTTQYQWRFGDGSTSQLPNPKHFYANAGSYTVQLKITSDSSGCVDSTTKVIHINPRPVAGFSFSPVCGALQVNFQDTSTIEQGTLSSIIYFGDGNSSTSQNPNHSYSTAGQYAARLITTSDSGCVDSVNIRIEVDSVLKADFQIQDQCERQDVLLNNMSTISGSTVSYLWDFGNGTSSTDKTPKVKYSSFGTYTVKLVVVSASNCSDSITRDIDIFSKPKARFSALSKCNSLDVRFSDSSEISNGTYALNFYFGDGSTTTTTPTSHTYSTPGRYVQSLVVETPNGCKDSISSPIFIDTLVVANFSPNDACMGDSIFFDNTSSVSGTNVSYRWNLGDGAVSTQMNPRHLYQNAGVYNVKLVVESKAGCSDSLVRAVSVIPKPNATASYNRDCRTDSIDFFGSGGNDNPRYIYEWTLGDGTTINQDNFSYRYALIGSYRVKLKVLPGTAVGCTDSTSFVVTNDSILEASFAVADSCANTQVKFVNTSRLSSGTINYFWSFSNGSKSLNRNPTRTFTAGQYNAQLIVVSSTGCNDTLSRSFEVHDEPRADFDAFDDCKSLEADFLNASSSNGTIANSAWSFGDGTTSTLSNPNHVYGSAGQYSVKLLVTGDKGCLDSITKDISIDSGLVANFSAQKLCNEDPTEFINTSGLSSGNIQYEWSFGDGSFSQLKSPSHQYALGTYTAKVVLYSSNGCEDSLTQTLVIEKTPSATFKVDTACYGAPVEFTDVSNAKGNVLTDWEWKFGTGDGATIQNPKYTFASGGEYAVNLVVTTDKNCTDTARLTVVQPDELRATLIERDQVSCAGLTDGRLQIAASGGLGDIKYQWSTASSDTTDEVIGLSAGTYTLTLTDSFACENQQSFVIEAPAPLSTRALGDRTICRNETVELQAITQGGTLPYTYGWLCDQNNCEIDVDNNERIQVSPSETTVYWTVVTDSAGCTSTSDSVLIKTELKPEIETKDTVRVLANEPVLLVAEGDKTLSYDWLPKEFISNRSDTYEASVSIDESTLFTVSARRDSGCASLDSIWVWVIEGIRMPTSFTPNDDGYNETWKIENIDLYPSAEVQIYNRLGMELYSNTGRYTPWNGKRNNKTLPSAAYFYVIDLNNGSDVLTGSVTILK